MSFKGISQIAGSAMTAQTVRLNTVASNLANAGTVAGSEEGAYRARKPVFAAVMQDSGNAAVQVLDVVKSRDPVRKAYEPGNPLADKEGMVYYPNVNEVEEMTDMMSATRAFQTNLEVLSRVKTMQQELLKMGESS
ncbi:flagellar basal body rod protein FlgC [Paludibacterium paludis]|uniref:Flagellar basal-body rod protein FlgC n=1 Tax=Paludibacterium paludis TaxID=1225769 RepID=A0A918NXF5_9NEIS|nr:flagellar basal body rod protein FlgC [Paludibacterium paludis]GGY04774.1 flagellar basal-body rod protein FlgC [Paludibacterium paludis]